MGLVCNMLKAIGGSPKIRVPAYPGHLPGGVRPHLTVFLSGLSKESVKMYMAIEEPEHPLATAEAQTFPTIGAFYDAIFKAFQSFSGQLSPDGQLTADISVPNPGGGNPLSESVTPLTTLAEVETAITTIKDQGEGTSKSPDAPEFGGELAHFYRFGEIFHGKRLIPVGDKFKFEGPDVPFPDCFDVPEVPREGYPESHAFDVQFTEVVNGLQDAWGPEGSQDKLDDAITAMFTLKAPARQLMQKARPSGGGNFGPDFKLVTP
jgi:Ferritin-like